MSGEAPKGGDRELCWLQRVVKSHLAGGIPGGMNVDATLEAIYLKGRNPIFHAKQDATFFAPQDEERQQIQELFGTLTFLLVSLLRYKLGHNSLAGWGDMSQAVYDAQSRATFEFDSLILRGGFFRAKLTPRIEVFDVPRRFGNIWARVTVEAPFRLLSIHRTETRRARQSWLSFNLAESVPLKKVASFTLELSAIHRHALAPKFLHST